MNLHPKHQAKFRVLSHSQKTPNQSLIGQSSTDQLAKLIGNNHVSSTANTSGISRKNSSHYLITDKAKKDQNRLTATPYLANSYFTDSVKQSLSRFLALGKAFNHDFNHVLQAYLDSPRVELVSGMIFGGSTQLPPELKHKIKVIGLMHVVSASGYNVSLMMNIGWWIGRRFCPVKFAGLGVGIWLVIYLVVAGATASLLRATLMGLGSLIARIYFHRQYRPGWGLLMTAVIMVGINSKYLTGVSFQLSVAASSGIIFLFPLMSKQIGPLTQLGSNQLLAQSELARGGIKRQLIQELIESWWLCISAQLLTLPLVMWHFGEISLLSFLANPLLLWLTPIVTLSGLALLASGLGAQIFFPLEIPAMIATTATSVSADVFIWGVSLLGRFEMGLLENIFLPFPVVVMWVALVGTWWLFSREKQRSPANRLSFFEPESP